MVDLSSTMKEFCSSGISDGARKLYTRGILMLNEGRYENCRAMLVATIGDAPALHFEALQQAQRYLEEGNREFAHTIASAVRDGLFLAVEAECKLLEKESTAAIADRHILDLTVRSGTRHSNASKRGMELSRAALEYIGQLEVLLAPSPQ